MAQKDAKKTKKPNSKKKSVAKKASGKKKSVKITKSELKRRVARAEKKATAAGTATVPKKTTPPRAPRSPVAKSVSPSPTWTIVALRARARAVGIVGYSRMKKDDLLAQLEAH